METADIPTTPESFHVRITSEDNVHHFLNIKGIIHFEFIPQGQTVNHAYYVEILKQLHEAVHRKQPELWPNDKSSPCPANNVLTVKQFLDQKSINEMKYLPCDFLLFPKIKCVLKV